MTAGRPAWWPGGGGVPSWELPEAARPGAWACFQPGGTSVVPVTWGLLKIVFLARYVINEETPLFGVYLAERLSGDGLLVPLQSQCCFLE